MNKIITKKIVRKKIVRKKSRQNIYVCPKFTISTNEHNWILMEGSDYSYYDDLGSLIEHVLEDKLKVKIKKDFVNLDRIFKDHEKEMKEMIGDLAVKLTGTRGKIPVFKPRV